MINQGAVIDPTGCYRYSLWRVWHPKGSRVAFIMLNPSRADATVDDPTIRRCIGFAQHWGYGSLEVVNLFAYRTSNPARLKQMRDPIGPENDHYLKQAIQRSKLTILAWGNRGNLNRRSQQVLSWLTPWENLYCLGVTRSGYPRHPLYLKRETKPIHYFTTNSPS
jgi:hypothetical protein